MRKVDVLSLKKAVLLHFQPNFNEGTVFLYNAESRSFWIGNSDSYEIIKRINGANSFGSIVDAISAQLKIPISKVYSEVTEIVEILRRKNFIIVNE